MVVLHNNPAFEVVDNAGKSVELGLLNNLAKAKTLTVGMVKTGLPWKISSES